MRTVQLMLRHSLDTHGLSADLRQTVTVPGPDRDARAWLDGDASHLGAFEPYDWGDTDPYTLGEPVRVGSDGDLVIVGRRS